MPVNTVLTPTKTPRPTPTHTLVPTNTPEPSNVLAPVKITGLLDHANWAVAGKSNATISLESTQINSRNVLSIDYSIAGNGNASIKTRENSIAFPEDRSKLIFAYKCSSQNSLRTVSQLSLTTSTINRSELILAVRKKYQALRIGLPRKSLSRALAKSTP